MADDADAPPAGPEGAAASLRDDAHARGVPNLQDLRGMLRVTLSAVRSIPLVPAPQAAASDGDAASPRVGYLAAAGICMFMMVRVVRFPTTVSN